MSDEYGSWLDYYDNGPGSEKMKRECTRNTAAFWKGRKVQVALSDSARSTDFVALSEDQNRLIKNMLNALGISEGLILDETMLLEKLRSMRRRARCWCNHVVEAGNDDEDKR